MLPVLEDDAVADSDDADGVRGVDAGLTSPLGCCAVVDDAQGPACVACLLLLICKILLEAWAFALGPGSLGPGAQAWPPIRTSSRPSHPRRRSSQE